MIKNNIKLIIATLLCCFLLSCSGHKKEESAEYEYTEAMKILKEKRYLEAAEDFEKIDENYPLSKWSIKGQVMAAYAYYKETEYDGVLRITEDFIELNPGHEDVPYMLYLKGRTFYDTMPNIHRGQTETQMASYNFRELIARFPYTIWSDDARKKIKIVDEHLAGAKMSVGRYEMRMENYVGAIMHFNKVINRYRHTNQSSEAYFRLYEVYYKLGMVNQAKKAKKALESIYPDNQWKKHINNDL